VRAGERAALAVVFAAMLSVGAARAVRCDVRHTATPALHTAAPALRTTPPLRQLHHRAHPGALATHRSTRRHGTPEIRAHHPALRSAGSVPARPASPAPARESHPRAALPVLVRPAHHPGWSGGARLACALPRESGTLTVCATTIPCDAEALVPNAGHEANEARGPPRPGPIALNPPAFARSPSFLPRARVLRSAPHWNCPARPALERDRGASGVARARREPARNPAHGPALPFVVPALPFGRADARRMESAAACSSGLSTGGVS